MGGIGSGARHRYARKTDEMHRLDLASFKRKQFAYGHSGTVTWSRNEHKTGSIGYRLWSDRMQLNYTTTSGGQKHSIEDTFMFAYTRQPFGGERRWIICPSCQRRCSVLYGGVHFRCRQCHGAVYPSQYEPFPQLPWSRCHAIRHKLGGEAGFSYPFPDRPKGMHWKTYYRLRDADWNAEAALDSFVHLLHG